MSTIRASKSKDAQDTGISVARIREMEMSVRNDKKKANFILDIRKILSDENLLQTIRLAAMHSLRRIFVHIMETGILLSSMSSSSLAVDSLAEYVKWITQQLQSYLDLLTGIISREGSEIQAAAIRTSMEFVQREHMFRKSTIFGVNTYTNVIKALLIRREIDIDILLMFRDEVLVKADCTYYGLKIVRSILAQVFVCSIAVFVFLYPYRLFVSYLTV